MSVVIGAKNRDIRSRIIDGLILGEIEAVEFSDDDMVGARCYYCMGQNKGIYVQLFLREDGSRLGQSMHRTCYEKVMGIEDELSKMFRL